MGNLKKFLFFVILFLLPIFSLIADETKANHIFSLSPLFGFQYGQADEIVYKYPTSDIYYSELLWDLRPMFYAGFNIDFSPRNPFESNGLLLSSTLKFGLTFKTGIIENRDWLGEDDELTHYSRHNLFLKRAILTDLTVGYSFRLTNIFALGAYLETSFMHYSWIAKDGFGQYPWGEHFFQGQVINYMQNWIIISPGLSLKLRLSSLLSLEGVFSYSPVIFCFARDHHIGRDDVFLDYPRWCHYFKGGGKLIVSPPLPAVDFAISVSYIYINGSRGNTILNGVVYNNMSGTAYYALDMGLALRIKIKP